MIPHNKAAFASGAITATSQLPTEWVKHYAQLAKLAMLVEVNLTPKPGLVDRANNGAHKDMTLSDFYASAEAIHPWLAEFIHQGARTHLLAATEVLPTLRSIGMQCEQVMFAATDNVNTHKGSIFSLGLLCTALGRLKANNQLINAAAICQEVAAISNGIVKRELINNNSGQTAGQKLYQRYMMTGARGQAESGYQVLINHILPNYLQILVDGFSEQQALHQALLQLIVLTDDTNVVSRGGIEALYWLKAQAKDLLNTVEIFDKNDMTPLIKFDQACIKRNISPGGCADLLILTWFLSQIEQEISLNK